MAFILIYLHGKLGQALSNQMRQTKAMWHTYSVKWWKERNLLPPEIDIKNFLLPRIRWRYEKGIPQITDSDVVMANSVTALLKAI